MAHRAGARRVDPHTVDPAPHPCLYWTGFHAFEPTLGVTDQGWVLYKAFGEDPNTPFGTSLVLRSKDVGRTWEDITFLARPQGIGDPYLWLDRRTGRVFSVDPQEDFCHRLDYSDDAGDTWVTNPQVCAGGDHENVFAGPPVSSPTIGYPNVVYFCDSFVATGTPAFCEKSLNGGLTFMPAGIPFAPRKGCPAVIAHGVVGPDGTVYIPKGWCGQPWIAISHDEGLTWRRVQVADNGMAIDLDQFGDFTHESAVAVDASGFLYYAWVALDGLPYLAVSRDDGSTWGKPMMIGPPGMEEAVLPGIDVGAPGRIAVVYMGRRTGTDTWDGYITISANVLARSPLFYSASANSRRDPLVRGPCGASRCVGAGDFFDIVIGPDGTPWAALSDACTGTCIHGEDPTPGLGEGVVGRLVGGPRLR